LTPSLLVTEYKSVEVLSFYRLILGTLLKEDINNAVRPQKLALCLQILAITVSLVLHFLESNVDFKIYLRIFSCSSFAANVRGQFCAILAG